MLAEKYHWTPKQVSEMTPAQISMYTGGDGGGGGPAGAAKPAAPPKSGPTMTYQEAADYLKKKHGNR